MQLQLNLLPYIILTALINIALTSRIIRLRRKYRIGIGTRGNESLALAVRAHGNFIEHTPLAILVILGIELSGAPVLLIHTLGCMLVIGRVLHSYGISRNAGVTFGRTIGTILTLLISLIGLTYLALIFFR